MSSTKRGLRLPEVMQKTGLKRSQILDAAKAGKFPQPYVILPGGRALAWDEAEVDQHMANQMAARDEPKE